MKHIIKKIDGKLLDAILEGARVFGHRCTETRAIVVAEPKKPVFTPKGNDTFEKHRYMVFYSDSQQPFYFSSWQGGSEAAMYSQLNKEWEETLKSEQLKKGHFR